MLRAERQSARVKHQSARVSKITDDGLARSGTGRFMATVDVRGLKGRLSDTCACYRDEVVPWWDVGVDASTLGQTHQRLLAERRRLRHQQDSRYLWLYQVRSPTQHKDLAVQWGRRTSHTGESHGRHCYTAGKWSFIQSNHLLMKWCKTQLKTVRFLKWLLLVCLHDVQWRDLESNCSWEHM